MSGNRRSRPFSVGIARVKQIGVLLAVAIVTLLTFGKPVRAELLIKIDKSSQRMVVMVNGWPLYKWPVSTGRAGYDTPSGVFRPFRMDIDHYSVEWDNAPMPYSIFFTRVGNAVHGTYEQRYLGRAVSHGCVRLSVRNAARLWSLVKREKMANTTVIVSGEIPYAGPAAASRSRRRLPLTTDVPRYAPPPYYQRRYNNRRPPPFSFYIFER